MLYRISKLGGGRMPQAGSFMVDHQAVDLFHRWIQSLPTKGPDAAAQARLAEQQQQEIALTSLQNAGEAPSPPTEHLGRLLIQYQRFHAALAGR